MSGSEDHESGRLSKREHQILLMAARGSTDVAIAIKLGISPTTVGTYWGRIRGKLGHHSRTELVANYMREKTAIAIADLKRENEILVQQLDDKSKTSDSMRTTLDLLRKVLGQAPDAIMLVNQHGIIEYANEEAERLFGYSRGELTSSTVANLIPERYHGTHQRHRRKYLEQPVKRRMGDHYGTAALRKNGEEFLTVTTLSAIQTPNGPIVSVFIRELDETNLIETGSESEIDTGTLVP